MGVAEIVSSTHNTSVGGRKPLNEFQYSCMHSSSQPHFASFKFNESELEALVKSKLLSDDADDVLSELSTKLKQLRSIIYSIKWVDDIASDAVWSETRIQCLMMLFLNHVFYTFSVGLRAFAANKDEIEFRVKDQDDKQVRWKGYTDVKCCELSATNINEAIATLEMKLPFNSSASSRLWKSKALLPKQQLLGQAMGLVQSNQAYHLSYLTDIFAVSVMYHSDAKFFLSERVTDAKSFCLRILLMLCGDLSTEQWDLLKTEEVDIDRTDEDDADDAEHQPVSNNLTASITSNLRSATILGPITRSQNKGDGGGKEGGVDAYGTFVDEEEEAHEQRLREIASLLRWEAQCLDYKYLGCKEMQCIIV